MTPEHRCIPSPDPRHPGRCACGQPLPHTARRDAALESRFLDDVIDLADKLGGVRWDGYRRAVRHRLAIGAERYGDTAFLERDNVVEIAEESPDLGAYSALELQRLKAIGVDEDDFQQDRLDLLAIAAYGALADHHVQRIRRRRAGLE